MSNVSEVNNNDTDTEGKPPNKAGIPRKEIRTAHFGIHEIFRPTKDVYFKDMYPSPYFLFCRTF